MDTRWKLVGAIACIFTAACGEPTAPVVQPTLDDALFHAQIADPLSAVAAIELGFPIVRTAVRRNDATLTRTYDLLDDAGTRQPEWNEHVTAIRLVLTYADDSTSWRDESTLRGLRSAQQRLTGTTTASWTRGGEAWTGERITDLVILSRVVMPGIFPTGQVSLTAERADARSKSIALSYDGSSIVSMLSSFDGTSSLVCTYDLLKPDASKSCR